ncbi:MAG: glycosyltransferase family 4 protein [Arenicellales bacterium]
MRKKVVMVHNTMHYLKLHYLELILNMVERGWSVTCVAPVDAAVSELERIGAGCVDLTLSRKGMNPLREVASVVKLYSILKRERPDMVLNFSIKPAIYGSIAARLAGIQRVCSMITGLGYVFLGQGPARRLLASLAAAAYKLALSSNRRVFFQNPDDARFFIQRGIVDPSQALVLAGTGIDTDRFHPGPAETPAKAQDGRVGYLLVGRLLADKGVREYVAAARALKAEGKPARCALLGPFDDNPAAIPRAEVERWVRDGLIEYLGETDDVAGALNNYDVFVLPSYREGLPRAALEAMSMGKPIVTTDVPGCRETVEEGKNGYLVPPRDPGRLKDAMEKFMAHRELIEAMGRRSRAMAVDRFDVRSVNASVVNAMMEA